MRPRGLLTPAWLARHALALGLVTTMLTLAGWQLSRASAGNALSWGYTIQWPVFAGFVVFVWLREMRRARHGTPQAKPDESPAPRRRAPVITRSLAAPPAPDDPDLAAYNRYLAWLNANPHARPADYPG